MNQRLIDAIKSEMKESNIATQKDILRMVAESGANDVLTEFLDNRDVIKVIDLAAAYVAAAISRAQKENTTWETLLGGAMLGEQLQTLLKNQSLDHYTLAVMIITVAMLKGEE